MKEEEIIGFINASDRGIIKDYLDGLKSKIEALDTKNDKISILLVLTIVAYFLIQNSLITNVNFGLIEINKADIGIIAIPPIFSLLLLYYTVLTTHKSELLNTSNILTQYYFKGARINEENTSKTGNFERQFLPYSFWTELSKVFDGNDKKFGCFAVLLILPILFALVIIPFWFQFYTVKILILNYWDKDVYAKPAVYLTCWINAVTFLIFIKNVKNATVSKTTEN
jgi:hypothetical protein